MSVTFAERCEHGGLAVMGGAFPIKHGQYSFYSGVYGVAPGTPMSMQAATSQGP